MIFMVTNKKNISEINFRIIKHFNITKGLLGCEKLAYLDISFVWVAFPFSAFLGFGKNWSLAYKFDSRAPIKSTKIPVIVLFSIDRTFCDFSLGKKEVIAYLKNWMFHKLCKM